MCYYLDMQKEYSYGKIRSDIYNENFGEKKPIQFRKSPLKKFALASGLTVLLYIIFGELVAYLLPKNELLVSLYRDNYYFRSGLTVILSIFMILIPFFMLFLFVNRKEKEVTKVFEKKPPLQMLPFIIVVSFAVIFFCNYITTISTSILGLFGIKAEMPEAEKNLIGVPMILFEIFSTALVPAVIEEFAIRGVLLQKLRKYGDTFAIIASSIIFGLMHMNLVQFIFATLLGIFISYAVIRTGSIWTGIAIHFCNNAYSEIMRVISQRIPDKNYTFFYLVVVGIIMVVAAISMIILSKNSKDFYSLQNPGRTKMEQGIYRKLALKTYFLHPVLIVVIAILVYSMRTTITFG